MYTFTNVVFQKYTHGQLYNVQMYNVRMYNVQMYNVQRYNVKKMKCTHLQMFKSKICTRSTV